MKTRRAAPFNILSVTSVAGEPTHGTAIYADFAIGLLRLSLYFNKSITDHYLRFSILTVARLWIAISRAAGEGG